MTNSKQIEMKEKLEILFQENALRNAQRNKDASTLSQFAASDAAQDAGRFAQINKASVIGSEASVQYPKLPEASPWHHDPVPNEEPFGVDVSEMPIVGEPHEVNASLGGGHAQEGDALTKAEPVTSLTAPSSGASPDNQGDVNEPGITKELGATSTNPRAPITSPDHLAGSSVDPSAEAPARASSPRAVEPPAIQPKRRRLR